LDALCERPLGGEGDALSPELEALCQRAVEVMSGEAGAPPDPAADPDRLPGLLAALYAGDNAEAERDAFARAAVDSPELRLDSESAVAFLDGLEERLEPTPAHLLPALEAARSEPSREPGRWPSASVSSMRRTSWRLASAFAVLLAAGLSWSIFGPDRPSTDAAPSGPAQSGPATVAKAVATSAEPPAGGELPALTAASKPPPTSAARPTGGELGAAPAGSCPPDTRVLAAQTASVAPALERTAAGLAQPDARCGGDATHLFADRAWLARARVRRAEAARQAEIARREAAEAGGEAAQAAAVPAAPPGAPEAIGVAPAPPVIGFGAPMPAAAARSSAGRSAR
jgi:hypothetical protein